jgi:nucleotide-binding universal stress UspA family protein
MFRALLVPLDGSPSAEQALPLAMLLARRTGAGLTLIHAHSPFEYFRGPSTRAAEIENKARAEKQAYLDAIAERIAQHCQIGATTRLVMGHPADVIHDQVGHDNTDLVVMTTHGRGPLSRFWLGSVADDLMRRLPVPMLILRPHETSPDWKETPALRRLLVPLDGSANSERALPMAANLGQLFDAQVQLVRVVDPLLQMGGEMQGHRTMLFSRELFTDVADIRAQQLAAAESYLADVLQRLRTTGVKAEGCVAQHPQPATAILETAQNHSVDLIVLATHGEGGLARAMFGSVADKVVRGASVPVLVVRPSPESTK